MNISAATVNVNRRAHGVFISRAHKLGPMNNKRRPVTEEKKQLAARLRRIWNAKKKPLGLTQESAGAMMGMTQGAVGQYLNGTTALGELAMLEFARVLKVPPSDIDPTFRPIPQAEKNVSELPLTYSREKVPLISWVQAGLWCEAVDIFEPGDAEEWLTCPVPHGPRTYILRVSGESNYDPAGPKSYADGDLIFVDPDKPADNGKMVVVRLEDDNTATFKRLLIEPDGSQLLKALNPDWRPRYMRVESEATICGVVIAKLVPE